ncbi:MAG: PhnD/SsuA/transferrin family substrate-binding protein [Gammaproteobacteria bacterium]|nr:PhnD/SsuA/transferrin family substrate-binding protein [Gammaproteobacteria bacterium]
MRIGVLSHRGVAATLRNWSPTADYLNATVPGYRFEVVPLGFNEVDPAVRFAQIDFLLVNSGIYVNMEVKYRVSRISTLDNLVGSTPYNVFGGVVFVRKDRRDINSLENLRGRSLIAVDETSLGGFQMAWREMRRVGIDPHTDLSSLTFTGVHDQVVMAVKEGRVDVGTVRTNILERMASAGTIDLDEFRIISPKRGSEFPFVRSTSLYPEWPFSKLQHTSNELAQRVAVALLSMPRFHPAAQAGNYAGWTVPLDYQSVHELFRELHLPPYQDIGKFTLSDAVTKYWYWPLLAVTFLISMFIMTTWVARLNRKLKRSKLHLEQQHELILNSVADGISGVDLEGNSTFANRAMSEITGWGLDELIGRNQHQMLHHSHKDGSVYAPWECPVYLTFRDSTPRYIDDDVFWKKDGSPFPVEYSSTPIRDDGGKVVGSVVVFRDISVRKQAEEDARLHQMELAHVARLSTMGEMASSIAHELNQPLTAIATNSHACIRMLETGVVDREKCADVLERIGAQAERAGEIIRHLRKFVSKEQPESTPVDINELIVEVLTLIRPEASRAGVRIITDLGPDIGAVAAQRIQIDQVIVNLLRNAIDAIAEADSPRREIHILTRMDGDAKRVVTTVADSGPGLDDETRKQLFTPFVTTKPKGMGLGLSISLGIIEAHNGNLFLDTAPGAGAVFRFTLPVIREAE